MPRTALDEICTRGRVVGVSIARCILPSRLLLLLLLGELSALEHQRLDARELHSAEMAGLASGGCLLRDIGCICQLLWANSCSQANNAPSACFFSLSARRAKRASLRMATAFRRPSTISVMPDVLKRTNMLRWWKTHNQRCGETAPKRR